MRTKVFRFVALLLALALHPAPARAIWHPDGNRVAEVERDQNESTAATTASDRFMVAWTEVHPTGEAFVYVQAMTSEGDRVDGWPARGLQIASSRDGQLRPKIVADGEGGAFVAWLDRGATKNARVQRVTALGLVADGWPGEGILLGPTQDLQVSLAADGAGGVLCGWPEKWDYGDLEYRIQHLSADGSLSSGWPEGGTLVPGAAHAAFLPEASGGFFVGFSEFERQETEFLSRLRVRRMHGDGTPQPSWPLDGVVVGENAAPDGLRLIPDDIGGIYVSWGRVTVCVLGLDRFGQPIIGPCRSPNFAERITPDGRPDPAWMADESFDSFVPDGAGGLLAGFVNECQPLVTRFDRGRSPAPGWSVSGNPVMTEWVLPGEFVVERSGDGGAFVAWYDWRTGPARLYVSKLDPNGRRAAGWPATGSFVTREDRSPGELKLLYLDAGRAVLLWTDARPTNRAIFAREVVPGEPGPLAPLRPVYSTIGFGVVQVRPNPARGPIVSILELPSPDPGTLELLDAAGRIIESREFHFGWPARGAVSFNQSGAHKPGVYWLRLRQSGQQSTAKVVLIE